MSAPQSIGSNLVNQITIWFTDLMVPHIIEILAKHGVEVGKDELIQLLELPAPVRAAPSTLRALSFPGTAATIQKTGGPRGKGPLDGLASVSASEKCTYIFSRGKQKDQECGVDVLPGTNRCKTHQGKEGKVSKAAPAIGTAAVRGLVAKPPSAAAQAALVISKDENFKNHPTIPRAYVNKITGQVIGTTAEGNVKVIGMMGDDGVTRPLNEAEKTECLDKGLYVCDEDGSEQPPAVPAAAVGTVPIKLTGPSLTFGAKPQAAAPPKAMPPKPVFPGLSMKIPTLGIRTLTAAPPAEPEPPHTPEPEEDDE